MFEELRRHFRPELVNRIDEIVVFNKLERDNIKKIVGLQLRELQDKLAVRKITLTVEESALEKIADEGFDPDFGARPLRRIIQREIQDALALKLLKGDISDGDTVGVSVDKSGRFAFAKDVRTSKREPRPSQEPQEPQEPRKPAVSRGS